MGALNKLEKVVVDALVARGMSEAEAQTTVNKLKSSDLSKFNGQDEVEVVGKLVACNPVIFRKRLPNSILVEFRNTELIIPLSQLDIKSEIDGSSAAGDVGIMVVNKWIAEKKGLI